MMYLNDKRLAVEHINKKWVKVLTVITYVISISLIALVLGLYYRLVWHPDYGTYAKPQEAKSVSLGSINVVRLNGFKDNLSQKEIGERLINILVESLKKENKNVTLTHPAKNEDSPTNNSYLFSFQIDFV